MDQQLTPMPDDWKQALAVVAHPDDLEYGAASAIARWTGEGRSVSYVIVTDGEAGIDGLRPAEAAAVRRQEQRTSAAIVGVHHVAFLGHHRAYLDGLGRDFDPEAFLHKMTSRAGAALGVPHAVAFGQVQIHGI